VFGWIADKYRQWWFNRYRLVFRYWDGSRTRLGDPLVLYRALTAHEDFRADDFKLLQMRELFPKIVEKLAVVYRDVFGVKKPEEGGLTEHECVANLRAFIEYLGLQKKSTGLTPILRPTTEQESSASSVPETSTSADSPSSSISTESNTGEHSV
jgi:hypothetical protein